MTTTKITDRQSLRKAIMRQLLDADANDSDVVCREIMDDVDAYVQSVLDEQTRLYGPPRGPQGPN